MLAGLAGTTLIVLISSILFLQPVYKCLFCVLFLYLFKLLYGGLFLLLIYKTSLIVIFLSL